MQYQISRRLLECLPLILRFAYKETQVQRNGMAKGSVAAQDFLAGASRAAQYTLGRSDTSGDLSVLSPRRHSSPLRASRTGVPDSTALPSSAEFRPLVKSAVR